MTTPTPQPKPAPKAQLPAKRDPGLITQLTNQAKLVWRLVKDRRVPFLLKLLPFGTLLYFIFPDFAPGPVDDALVVALGTSVFIEMAPAHVVAEIRRQLRREAAENQEDAKKEPVQQTVIIAGEPQEVPGRRIVIHRTDTHAFLRFTKEIGDIIKANPGLMKELKSIGSVEVDQLYVVVPLENEAGAITALSRRIDNLRIHLPKAK